MRKLVEFRLGRRMLRWVFRMPHHHRHNRYRHSKSHQHLPSSSVTRTLARWRRLIARRLLCCAGNYRRLHKEEEEEEPETPKGHLAVYVGGGGGEGEWAPAPQRYLVPLIYFNHPLFGDLLREAGAEFGFSQPGGITIPCPLSKFEHVRTRIAATQSILRIPRLLHCSSSC